MIVVNTEVLAKFVRKHRDAGTWLQRWLQTTESAEWMSLDDVRDDFPSADGVPLAKGLVIVTVFNVRGNTYRMTTLISYVKQIVSIQDVMTHAEYDKNKWKARYE